MPDERWRQRLGRPDSVSLVATSGGRWIGLVGGFREPPTGIHLISMWVEPASRGRGIAAMLVAAVLAWGREVGAEEVRLWVADGNDAANALYAGCGFSPTGTVAPLPSNPAISETEMRRPLSPAGLS